MCVVGQSCLYGNEGRLQEASQQTQSRTFTKHPPDFSKVFLEDSFSDLHVLPERSWKPSGISAYLHCPSAGPV